MRKSGPPSIPAAPAHTERGQVPQNFIPATPVVPATLVVQQPVADTATPGTAAPQSPSK